MPLRRVRTPVEQLQPFERGRTVVLRIAGWTYRRIAEHLGTMYRWCVATFSSGLWNIPTPVHQDLRNVRAVVAARTASREEMRTHVVPAVSPRTIGNHLPAAGLDHVCLWPGYRGDIQLFFKRYQHNLQRTAYTRNSD